MGCHVASSIYGVHKARKEILKILKVVVPGTEFGCNDEFSDEFHVLAMSLECNINLVLGRSSI